MLSDDAMQAVRAQIATEYGAQFLSPQPKQYTSKVKNAQEAHEAIRPTTPLRSPQAVQTELNSQELSLYRLIWQRTLASQMADAVGTTVTVRLGRAGRRRHRRRVLGVRHDDHVPRLPPGVRRVPRRGQRRTARSARRCCRRWPSATRWPIASLEPQGHSTSPPARFTEASLVKRLEELGIGRPSTWSNIIQTVQDRGYIWKKGQALVPTWTAFAVVNLMEQHFDELVDYAFTAHVETDLDAIAAGDRQKDQWLKSFYFGDDTLPGLKRLVEENLDEIDAAVINTFPLGLDADGIEVVVKPGKYGPYVKRGDDTASVPEELTPDELTLDQGARAAGRPEVRRADRRARGLPVFAKNGRYGPYVQWGTPDEPPPGFEKPKMSSLFKTMVLERITLDEATELLQLPRTLGVDPADGETITANNGRYGPYVQKGRDFRNLENEERLLTVTLDDALQIFAQPKVYRRGGQNMAAKGPLKRVRHRSRVRAPGRRPRRQVRGVRHRRRDERVDRQGRPHRGDAPRAGLRAAGDPPRDRRRQGRRPGEAHRPQGPGQEGRRPQARRAQEVLTHPRVSVRRASPHRNTPMRANPRM